MDNYNTLIIIFMFASPILIYIAYINKKLLNKHISPFREGITKDETKLEKKEYKKIDPKIVKNNQARLEEIKKEEETKNSYTTIKKDLRRKIIEDKEENSFYKVIEK